MTDDDVCALGELPARLREVGGTLVIFGVEIDERAMLMEAQASLARIVGAAQTKMLSRTAANCRAVGPFGRVRCRSRRPR